MSTLPGVALLSTEDGSIRVFDEALLWLGEAARNNHVKAKALYEELCEQVSDEEIEEHVRKDESGEKLIKPHIQQEKKVELRERIYKVVGKEWNISGDGSGFFTPIVVERYHKSFDDFHVDFLNDLYQMMGVAHEVIQSGIDDDYQGYVLSRITSLADSSDEFIDVRFFDFSTLALQRLNQLDNTAKTRLEKRLRILLDDKVPWNCYQINKSKFHYRIETWGGKPNRPLPVHIEIEELTNFLSTEDLSCPDFGSDKFTTKVQENFISYVERLGCTVTSTGGFLREIVAGKEALVGRHALVNDKTSQYLQAYSIVLMNQNCLYGVKFVIDAQYQNEFLEPVANAMEFVETSQGEIVATYERELQDLVAAHLSVFYQVEARDVKFRMRLGSKERQQKSPWVMLGREGLHQEELKVWRELDNEDISDSQAVEKFTQLMKSYYSTNFD